MLIFLFSLFLALTAFLLLYAIIRKVILPQTSVRQRIFALENNDNNAPIEASKPMVKKDGQRKLREIPFMERVVKPAGERLAESVSRMTPKQVLALVEKRLVMAGKAHECTAPQFVVICLIGALSMWFVTFTLVGDGNFILIQKIVFMLLGGVMGGFMPIACLNTMMQKRQAEIARQLPEVLDLLCVSVQAGLSFDAALSKITGRMKGELISECKRLQEDIRMGMVRRTAMKNLASRCDVQDVSLFMTSVIQAERLGTSMSKTLKNQADNIRERRRQFVKAQAMKAPVKIVFPLVLFIFPALFVVTLVPTLLFLLKNM
ncbi:putative type II secretion system protein F [Selenomonas ruminantium subsp. lactilytica TAM6421]|uniref:Putative type II secretion system protein F n=1 Tax=Selenomonas ruminantium subsp. lactilytica (strain NBRC 103574 / TAM6421) TaxID=927704 RepID=I0GS31_SELRL|nr:type II secretion system F family protein [Selenomonas ruminantium]BAL83568.1 putative type II secretion system protein F [Selenomonas ruminantium subsp. lactilytica TAM6421]